MRPPSEMIESLEELQGEINRRHHALACEIDGVIEQWDALKRHGVRDDHAASLLGMLRPHLEDIAAFCTLCKNQIDGMVRNPFGRED